MRFLRSQALMRGILLTVWYIARIAAAVQITNSDLNVVPGDDFTITWAQAEGPVEITLGRGNPANIQRVLVIGKKFRIMK